MSALVCTSRISASSLRRTLWRQKSLSVLEGEELKDFKDLRVLNEVHLGVVGKDTSVITWQPSDNKPSALTTMLQLPQCYNNKIIVFGTAMLAVRFLKM